MTPTPSFAFVRALFQCRELSGALARYADAGTHTHVRRSLAAGFPSVHGVQQSDDVCQGTALVAKLVLQDLDASEHQFTRLPTGEGMEVLAALQAAVFGPGSADRPFTECVFMASLTQARMSLLFESRAAQALELVTAALLDALAPSNCLSLLNAAAACGCGELEAAARRLALAAFPAAWRSDPSGLLAMEEPLLLQLLTSDRLQVASEVEVCQALCAWTEYDVAARRPQLAARLASCVRLGTANIPELQAMDEHPLVHGDRQTCQLIATVYMTVTMGGPVDCPLGFPTSARRRLCQRGSAAAAAEVAAPQRACGLAEHAGQHGSVFEAAVCALARQRQQREDAASEAAAEADMRRLSVDGAAAGCSAAAASPAAACVARVAPASPLVQEAPTPTAAGAAAQAAPAVQPVPRVRHVGLGKRVGSRRALFDLAGGAETGAQQQQPELQDGSKAAAAAPKPLAVLAASSSAAAAADVVAGGVSLEMRLSPNHASLRALVAQAAAEAAAPQPGGWGRKRLRFD